MADYATFIAEFPEFAAVDSALVSAKLARAVLELDSVSWDTLYDQGVYLLTAQKLAKSPSGNTSKLMNKDGSTVYDDDLDLLRTMVAGGVRVAGQTATPTPPLGPPIEITGATNASPIVLTVASAATLASGRVVYVSGVLGNLAANGTWVATVVDSTHVSLNGTTGNGAYTGGGTLQLMP